jgi:hypothetical protein
MIIEYYPPNAIALNKELASGLHPKLAKQLDLSNSTNAAERLGVVAAYCMIELDGMYDDESLERLCGILVPLLEKIRERNPDSILLLQ